MPSIVSVNGAGGSAGNPIGYGLPISLPSGAESVDAAQSVGMWIDPGEGFPGVTSVTSSLYPAASVIQPAGLTGTWANSTRILTVANVGSAEAGMYIGVSVGSTKGYGLIEQVVSSTQLRLLGAPFTGDASNVGYQIFWAYRTYAGVGGSAVLSSITGKLNVLKFQAADALGNLGNNTPGLSFYVRDLPANAVVINNGSHTGQRIAINTPTFDLLPDWTNKGGIVSLELVTSNGLTWWDGSTGERTWATIASRSANDRLKIAGTDGQKSAVLRARTYPGASRYTDLVTISLEYDATAPQISANVTTSGPF